MDHAILDTDMLNEVLKQKNSQVLLHAAAYLRQHGQFVLSSMTRYELVRGLKEKNASHQLARFATFCQQSLVLPVTDSILDRAGDLWVAARRGGFPGRDADLIIAATALEHSRVLVTGNTTHFAWIPGLKVADWRKP
ncbi:MAG: type II toxin-antitoxin system VapC family toxin [Planctomycetota bacterium]|nr:type II toxin-antitoxin system VapC family toxin [Planctomycetota bacterium]